MKLRKLPKDFLSIAGIKVPGGRDCFSTMDLRALRELHRQRLGNPQFAWLRANDVSRLRRQIKDAPNPKRALAIGLRWVLRGFCANDAAHKTNVDIVVAQDIIQRRRDRFHNGKWDQAA